MKQLAAELLTPADQAARRLLGARLERTIDGKVCASRIIETESYHPKDPASHSFRGQTKRTEVMFGPPGNAYVYLIYGMYYCLNVVTGAVGDGSAVLIRAVEPIEGAAYDGSGPGKLCRALQIDSRFNGHDLATPPLKIILNDPLEDTRIVRTKRIGITKASDDIARFYICDNPFISRLH